MQVFANQRVAVLDKSADLRMMGDQDELLLEMETMLRDQVEASPMEVRPRLRLAKVHAELRRTDSFLEDARAILTLVQNEAQHPARAQLEQIARNLKVSLPTIGGTTGRPAGPARRLGEDADSRAYFDRLNERFQPLRQTPAFTSEHDRQLIRCFNRPSPLVHLPRLSKEMGGAQLAIKREDMLGQGTRLIMSVAGQVLLAYKLGYSAVVTGSSSIRTAVVMTALAARYDLASVVFISEQKARQHSSLLLQLRCTGAKVMTPNRNQNARDEAMDFCLQEPKNRFMVLGVEAAPEPFSQLNEDLVSALGREVRAQSKAQFRREPDMLVCRGKRTADAVGFFDPFLDKGNTRLVCVEALDSLEPAAEPTDNFDPRKVQQLTDEQLLQADAILEGSEFPSVRREHAKYKLSGRVEYASGSTVDARSVIKNLAFLEGLIVPVRTAFPLGWAARHARKMKTDELVVINMVEPYDKDLREIARSIGITA